MQEGAIGISTGLYYAPGSFSSTEEVIELARIAALHGGIYDTHMRDESSYTIGLLGVGSRNDPHRRRGTPSRDDLAYQGSRRRRLGQEQRCHRR